MKIFAKDGKPCEKILKIEVDGQTVQKEYQAFYNAVAPKAAVPGFRPGKAPRRVLEMHYAAEARESVLKQLLSDSYREALKEKLITPLGFPLIEDVKFEPGALSYQARVEIRPKIKLSRVEGLKAKKEKPEVKPEEIEEALGRLRESFAHFKAVEDRPAALGDFLIADYLCLVEGKEIDKRQDDWIELREEEFLKGFSAQLAGSRPGEEKEVRVTFPQDFARKEHAGKEAAFQVKVKEIKSKQLPALDDELAKEAGECQTLAELRQKVEKDLSSVKEKEAEAGFEKGLLDELVKHNKIDLPEGLVAKRLERLVEDAAAHYQRHGVPEATLKELKEKSKQELAPEARRQVHVAFLLDEIAVKENLTASEEDLKLRFNRIAAQVRQPVEKVEHYYRHDEEGLESLRDQIRSEKAVEFIKRHAKTA